MKRLLMFLALAAPAFGGDHLELRATGISKEPTTWHGQHGVALTIRFAEDTKAAITKWAVCLKDDDGQFLGGDYVVPVMKRKPREVILFFQDFAPGVEESVMVPQIIEGAKDGWLVVTSHGCEVE